MNMGTSCVVCNSPVEPDDDARMLCEHVAHARCLVETQHVELSQMKCPRCGQHVFVLNYKKYQSVVHYIAFQLVRLVAVMIVSMTILRGCIVFVTSWIYIWMSITWFFEPFFATYSQ